MAGSLTSTRPTATTDLLIPLDIPLPNIFPFHPHRSRLRGGEHAWIVKERDSAKSIVFLLFSRTNKQDRT
jgi:hypothetical protein